MVKEKEQISLLPWALPQPFRVIWAKSLPSLWLLFVLLAVSLGMWSPTFIPRHGNSPVGAGQSPVAML